MKITFRMVAIGERFTHNGNTYVKKSTRTAEMLNFNRVFYIEQLANCETIDEEVSDYGFMDVGGMTYDEVRFSARGE